jgi:hypothetical protein
MSSEISADGSTVLFKTRERLVRGDRNAVADLYAVRGGETTRIGRAGNFPIVSAFGRRVLFISSRQLLRADRDRAYDLYSWTSRGIRLLSPGAAGGSRSVAFQSVILVGATPNARHAYFQTLEPLVRADHDRTEDLYAYTGGRLRLLTRPSR